MVTEQRLELDIICILAFKKIVIQITKNLNVFQRWIMAAFTTPQEEIE